jgi:hypothetical protein
MRWVVVLLVAGCASAHLPRVPGEPPPMVADVEAERRYQQLLERATRSAALYDAFDTRAFLRAAWQSRSFVEARVRREGEFKAIGAAELEALLTAEQARCASATEFFLAVHANDPKYDDFSRPGSMWRLALLVDGRELLPLSVERLGRTTLEMRSYYSWMESYWVAYRVRFPPLEPGATRAFTFQLASAVGQARLEFTTE